MYPNILINSHTDILLSFETRLTVEMKWKTRSNFAKSYYITIFLTGCNYSCCSYMLHKLNIPVFRHQFTRIHSHYFLLFWFYKIHISFFIALQKLFLVVTALNCSVLAVKPPNYIEKPKVPDKVSTKPTIYLFLYFHFICLHVASDTIVVYVFMDCMALLVILYPIWKVNFLLYI